MNLIIVSANHLARLGLLSMLDTLDGCDVVSDLADELALVEEVDTHDPDIIVWDMSLNTDRSLQSLQDYARTESLPPVVILLPDDTEPTVLHTSGAAGILPPESSPEQIEAALNAVLQGLFVLDSSFVSVLPAPSPPPQEDVPEVLTPRENEVLQLLAQGLPNKLIAQQLNISTHTVKFHVNALLTKLNAQSRTEAVVNATRLGLIIL